MRNKEYSPREIDRFLNNRKTVLANRCAVLAKISSYKEALEIMRQSSAFQKMEEITQKYGYRLDGAQIRFGSIEIIIRPTKQYQSDINFRGERYGKTVNEFTFGTVGKGDLSIDEYAEFLKAGTDAYKMIREIEDEVGLYDLVNMDEYM